MSKIGCPRRYRDTSVFVSFASDSGHGREWHERQGVEYSGNVVFGGGLSVVYPVRTRTAPSPKPSPARGEGFSGGAFWLPSIAFSALSPLLG
jgi:hypothetical protein